MSLHIRRTLEQAYLQNLKNRDIQVITVSLEDQAEVRNDFNILCKKKGISNPIRIQLTPEDYFAPLSPILYIINELLSRNGIELTQVSKLLKLGKYESTMLNSMLQNRFDLHEYYMPSDIEYIKLRIRKHIQDLLNHLLSTSEPIPICICNLQYAGPSSINFLVDILKPKIRDTSYVYSIREPSLNEMQKKAMKLREEQRRKRSLSIFSPYNNDDDIEVELRNDPNCVLLLGFNSENLLNATTPSKWLEMEGNIERYFTLIRPNDSDYRKKEDNSWEKLKYQAKPICTFDEAVERCGILFNYMCYDEVIEIANSLIQEIRFSKDTRFKNEELIYHLLGRARLYKHEYEDALIAFDLMYEKAQYNNNTDDACNSYIELAYTHIFRSDFESVLHFAEMAAHLGEISMNMRLVVISNFCLFVAYDRAGIKYGYHNICTLVNNLEKYDLIKEEVYVLRNAFAQVSLDPQNMTMNTALDMCNKAITLASRAGIKHEIAATNHCRGVVLFNLGRYPDALHAYRMSEEQYYQIEVPVELTHVYNSIGFVLNETEEYPKAHEYYMKALRNSINLNDYSEITITIYNIAQLYILSGLFKEALSTLDILQEILSVLGTNRLPFHNIHHIYLSKALVYTNLNQINFAEQMLRRSANISTEIPLYGSELFLYNLIQTIVHVKNKQIDQALNLFEKIRKFQKLGTLTPKENILFYMTAIRIFNVCHNYEEQFHYLKEGYAYAIKNQLFNSQKLITNCWRLNFKPYEGYSVIEVPINELNQIIQLVRQEHKVNTLWKQVHEMRLISMLHNFSLSVDSYNQLAAETIRLLSSHFNINGGIIYFVDKEEHTSSLIHEFNSSKIQPNFSFKKIEKFINSHISTEFQELTDVTIGPDVVHRIMIYPLIDRTEVFGQMLLFSFDKSLKRDHKEEHDSITMISQQLSSQLIMILQRNELIRVSTTDMLTGLYNRMEFNRLITKVIRELPSDQNIALGFMDLDNFKYYNDNLGHDIGDKLLVWFAELINSLKDKTDIACRWGGDEFLLLMKNCNAAAAEKKMQTILNTLKSKMGYKHEIEEFLGTKVDNLPERYYLSCSIGVMDSSSLPRPFTESELLTHADAALYEVKRTGKGKVLNFENMTHEADGMIMESNR